MNPNNTSGVKLIGFAALRDEYELLDGWVKTLRHFCDEVWAIADPRSTDGTNEKLESYVKLYKDSDVPVYIYWQDITLGDSDRDHKGKKGEITFLMNANNFLENVIPVNTWTMWIAADERLDTTQTELLYRYLESAEFQNYNAVVFKFYDIYPDFNHYVNYEIITELRHCKLIKNTRSYRYGITLHSSLTGTTPYLKSNLSFFHFGNLYQQDRNWWRTTNGVNYAERIPEPYRFLKIQHPFLEKDWKTEA